MRFHYFLFIIYCFHCSFCTASTQVNSARVITPHPAALAAAAAAAAEGDEHESGPKCVVCLLPQTPATLEERKVKNYFACSDGNEKDSVPHRDQCCVGCTEELLRERNAKCPLCRTAFETPQLFKLWQTQVQPIVYQWSAEPILNLAFHRFAFQKLSRPALMVLDMEEIKGLRSEAANFSLFDRQVGFLDRGGVYLDQKQQAGQVVRYMYVIERIGSVVHNTIYAIHRPKLQAVLIKVYQTEASGVYPENLDYPFALTGELSVEAAEKERQLHAQLPYDTASSQVFFSQVPRVNRAMEKFVQDATVGALGENTFRRYCYIDELIDHFSIVASEIYSIVDVKFFQRTNNGIEERYLAIVSRSDYFVTKIIAIAPDNTKAHVSSDFSWNFYIPPHLLWPFNMEIQDRMREVGHAQGVQNLLVQKEKMVLIPLQEVNDQLKVRIFDAEDFHERNRVSKFQIRSSPQLHNGLLQYYEIKIKDQVQEGESGFGYMQIRYISVFTRIPGMRLVPQFVEVVYAISPKGQYVAISANALDSESNATSMSMDFENPFDEQCRIKPRYSNFKQRNEQALDLLRVNDDGIFRTEFSSDPVTNSRIGNYVLEGNDQVPFDIDRFGTIHDHLARVQLYKLQRKNLFKKGT